MQIKPEVKVYMDHFGMTASTLQKVIAEAMSKGGDYADLFFEHKLSNNLALEDEGILPEEDVKDILSLWRELIDYHIAIDPYFEMNENAEINFEKYKQTNTYIIK